MLVKAFVLLVFFLLPKMLLAQQEHILFFGSLVTVQKDATLHVRETIRVRVAGKNRERGLYRDFPVHYSSADGQKYDVSLDVLSVQRDGAVEPYTVERMSGMVRLYIGGMEGVLRPGVYTYTITYKTNGHIRFLDNNDELQWNVTGNRWDFAIDTVRAVVVLPDSAQVVRASAYTDSRDDEKKGEHYRFWDSAGCAVFVSTQGLRAKEEFVVYSSWQKGIVAEQREATQRTLFWKNNVEYVVGGIGVVVVFVWFLVFWLKSGNHLEDGHIVAQHDIPKGLSPAAIRVINRMGYDRKAMVLALINMAMKGALSIENKAEGKVRLLRHEGFHAPLAADEEGLFRVMFEESNVLVLHTEEQKRICRSEQVLKRALKEQCEGAYFRANVRVFLGGVLLSCVVLAGLFLPVLLDVLSVSFRIIPLCIVLPLLLILNMVFYRLLKVPTAEGRILLDQIEGVRQFLVGRKGEQENSIPVTKEVFEQYLPYALALDVEQVWGENLAKNVSANAQQNSALGKGETLYIYNPPWYSGVRHADMRAFSTALETALSEGMKKIVASGNR